MNKGIAIAKGAYISFLNSDDAYPPDTVRAVLQAFEDSDADIVYGNITKEREIGNQVFYRDEKPDLHTMKSTMGVFHPSTFMKRTLFKSLGSFDLRFKLAADYHWFLKAYLAKAKFHYLEKSLAIFNVGGISNYSCESYREAIMIQTELDTGTSDAMELLYAQCQKKMRRQRIVASIARLPILKSIYFHLLKKRWQ